MLHHVDVGEDGLHCVQRARADVSIDDACAQWWGIATGPAWCVRSRRTRARCVVSPQTGRLAAATGRTDGGVGEAQRDQPRWPLRWGTTKYGVVNDSSSERSGADTATPMRDDARHLLIASSPAAVRVVMAPVREAAGDASVPPAHQREHHQRPRHENDICKSIDYSLAACASAASPHRAPTRGRPARLADAGCQDRPAAHWPPRCCSWAPSEQGWCCGAGSLVLCCPRACAHASSSAARRGSAIGRCGCGLPSV